MVALRNMTPTSTRSGCLQNTIMQGVPPSGYASQAARATAGKDGTPASFSDADFPALGGGESSSSAGAASSSVQVHLPSGASAHAAADASGNDMSTYGLAGLHAATKTVATTDLTSLGLSLNSRAPLHSSFGLPWVDKPTVPDANCKTPDCYKLTPPPLRTGHFSRFDEQTLMYIFYCLPRDTLQVCAAHELYSRKWQYHIEMRMWFTPTADPTSGQFHFFNVHAWEKQVFTSEVPGGLARGLLAVSMLPPLPAQSSAETE